MKIFYGFLFVFQNAGAIEQHRKGTQIVQDGASQGVDHAKGRQGDHGHADMKKGLLWMLFGMFDVILFVSGSFSLPNTPGF